MLVDVAMSNPICPSRTISVEEGGRNGVTVDYGKLKRKKYYDIDQSKYTFLLFVIETCGGIGAAAETFCNKLIKRRQSKQRRDLHNNDTNYFWKEKLLCSISVVVQKANYRMILEREPIPTKFIMERIARWEMAVMNTMST